MALTYMSAFGVFQIPADVYGRSLRLAARYGRSNYLDEWCCHQWKKGER